jgi:hypothetical protein
MPISITSASISSCSIISIIISSIIIATQMMMMMMIKIRIITKYETPIGEEHIHVFRAPRTIRFCPNFPNIAVVLGILPLVALLDSDQ